MAIDTGMYTLTQFQVAVKAETTLGTVNNTAMQLVNIEGYPAVNKNTERFLDIRSGTGRTIKVADAYLSQNGKEKEVSFTALYDQTLAPIFISNCMGVAIGASPASYDIAYNYTGPECAHGDTDTDNTGALTLALISPETGTGQTTYLPGCFVKTFRMYADMATDGGRFKMDVTLASRHNFNAGNTNPTGLSAYPTTYRTIYDLATVNKWATFDIVINRIEITLNSNVKFYGFGAAGIPDVIGRGIPNFDVDGIIGMKYDLLTAAYTHQSHSATEAELEISNNAAWASATFGFKGSDVRISEDFDPVDVESGAFMDMPVKFTADTSGDVIQIVP